MGHFDVSEGILYHPTQPRGVKAQQSALWWLLWGAGTSPRAPPTPQDQAEGWEEEKDGGSHVISCALRHASTMAVAGTGWRKQ